jgi:serine/threonine-protein kinase
VAPDPLATAEGTVPVPSGGSADPSRSNPRSSSGGLSSEGRFLPGTLLAERYRIVALLGRGGMGEVYRADDLTLGQPVALKFLPKAAAKNEEARERFRHEVRIARRVSHPNVCRVYDVGEAEGQTFLSMEYVDGEDLASLLRRIGRLPGDKALEIARQLCAGLAAAHREGVLHRDLKPANVMLDGRGRAVMTDFGLAGLADQIQGLDVRSGTPAYMAPEQLAGKEVTVKSDIYSLGLVLYEVFAGKPAFAAAPLAELVRSRREDAPNSPATWVQDLDPTVERVIMRCLERDPGDRPNSALAVAAALPGGDPLAAALANGETPSPQMVAAAGTASELAPRTALWSLIAVLLGVALVVFLGIRESGLERMNLENPPADLAQKARDIVTTLGYPAKSVDRASGFSYEGDLLNYLGRSDQPRPKWDEVLSGRPSLLSYWYRQSPRPMVPGDLHTLELSPGVLTFDDPPPILSGMVRLRLDPQGRLVYWQAIPPEVDTTPPSSGPADWSGLFAAAGLEPAQFQPTEPTWVSLAAFDARAAWTGTWPGSTQPLRIEAAAWRGRPVFFSLIGPWSRPSRMQASSLTSGQKAGQTISIALVLLVLLAAVLLARRNQRKGKSDLRGAFRLAGAVFVIGITAWLCLGHFVATADAFGQFVLAIGIALFVAGTNWVLYVALEPYVRRHWPQTIISWSRLLTGRLRDPLVGRDLLTGVLLGTVWTVLFSAGYFFQMRAGARPQFAAVEYLLGTRSALGMWVGNMMESVRGTLVFFFVLFLLRVLLRNKTLAVICFVLIFSVLNGLGSEHPWIAAPVWLVIYSIAALAVVRFGLVVLATGVFTANVLLNLPFTLDVSHWYAGTSLAVLLSFVAIAVWGFFTSLGGRKLWKEGMFE